MYQTTVTARSRTDSLYARVTGDAWFHLAAPVRALHSPGAATRARGFLRVAHGPHRLTRIIARLFRLPAPAAATPTDLSIAVLDDGEQWQRAFGSTLVETHQFSDGLDLVERYSVLEFRFRLEASDRRLSYHQREAALRFLMFGLRLPGSLAPRIEAHEEAVAPGRVKIAVTVTLPIVGLLIAYDGIIDVAETVA